MLKLNDTQLIILSKAAARGDGAATRDSSNAKAAVAKAASGLIARKLMREVRSKADMPIWRKDEDGRPLSLIIMRAGRDAIGVTDRPTLLQAADKGADKGKVDPPRKSLKRAGVSVASAPTSQPAAVQTAAPYRPRAGSKQSNIIAMLSAVDGATLGDLVEATGWLPHTTRAALTGLRKKGYVVDRSTGTAEQPSSYRITQAPAAFSAR